MKPSFQLICLLSLLSQAALAATAYNPAAQINLATGNNGNLILSGHTLCDSDAYRIRIKDEESYKSGNGNMQWPIAPSNCDANAINSFEIKREFLQAHGGKVLEIQTLANNSVRHTFEYVIPCTDAELARAFNGRWKADSQTSGALNANLCQSVPVAPSRPQPSYPQPQQPTQVIVVQQAPQAPAGPTTAQIINLGKSQGSLMAKNVFNYYGQLEMRMFSYAVGLNQGIQSSQMQNEQYTTQFTGGQNSGRNFGQSKGQAAGLAAAQSAGANYGSSMARSRFDSIMDQKDASGNQMRADITMPTAPSLPPQQFNSQCPAPISIDAAINQQNGMEAVKQMLFGVSFAGFEQGEDFDQQIGQNLQDFFTNFSINDYYSAVQANNFRRANFANSYGNPDWAFSNWSRGSLQGQKPYNIDFFQSLNSDQQNIFINEFKQAFVNKMSKDMDQNMNGQLIDARFSERGMQNAQSAIRNMWSQHGVVAGCEASFLNAAQSTYAQNFSSQFSNNFSSVVQTYTTRAEIGETSVSILEANGRDSWLPGSGVKVNVSKIVNEGEASAQLTVSADDVPGVIWKGAGEPGISSVTANPSSNNLRNQTSPRLTTLQNPPLNREMQITVNVNGQAYSLPVKVTVDKVVQAMATAPNAGWLGFYKGYLIKNLTAEWNDNKGGAFTLTQGIYGDGSSLLNQVSLAYRSLTPEQQNTLKQNFNADLKSIYVNGGSKRTKEALAILSQIN